jgi:hypothetical protein
MTEVRLPSVVEDRFANSDGLKVWLMHEAKDQHERLEEFATEQE